MIGAFSYGARVLRCVSHSSSPVDLPSGTTLPTPATLRDWRDYQRLPTATLNWSQKRFLRGQSSKGPDKHCPEDADASCEIDGGQSVCEESECSVMKKKGCSYYSQSVRRHQSQLLNSLPKTEVLVEKVEMEASKLIIETGPAAIRVRNNKEDVLLREWIGIQNELRIIKNDRVEVDRQRLQIAGQEVLKEMARLTKSINLDELDQAIEGALCSQAKTDYSQQTSSHDN